MISLLYNQFPFLFYIILICFVGICVCIGALIGLAIYTSDWKKLVFNLKALKR
jgi:hypothetical protein